MRPGLCFFARSGAPDHSTVGNDARGHEASCRCIQIAIASNPALSGFKKGETSFEARIVVGSRVEES